MGMYGNGAEPVPMSVVKQAQVAGDMGVIRQAASHGMLNDDMPTESAPVETEVTQTVSDNKPDAPEDPAELFRQEVSRLERELSRMQDEKAQLARLVEETRSMVTVPPVAPAPTHVEPPKIEVPNIKPEDFETEYDYLAALVPKMQETLAKVAETSQRPSTIPDLDEIRQMVEEIKTERERKKAEAEQRAQHEAIRSDMKQLWEAHPDLNPGKSVDEVEREFAEFRHKISVAMGDDERIRNRTLARLGDPVYAEATMQELAARGIQVPENYAKVWDTIALFNYQSGFRIDPATGNEIDITDKLGVRQRLPDLTSAYHLMHARNLLATQRKEAFLAIQNQLNRQKGAAAPVDFSKTVPIGGKNSPGALDTARAIFAKARANPHLIRTDENFAKQFEQASALLRSML